MVNDPQQPENESRGIDRRQMIVGSGVAAAAWAAPSVLHIDIASAAGSGVPVVTVTPGAMLPSCVSVNPNVTDMVAGELVFGQFGRGDGNASNPVDNGPTFTLTFSGVQPHTMLSGSMRICYENDWESGGGGGDTMDVRVGPVGGLGTSFGGFPTSNVGVDVDQCIDYVFGPIGHTDTTFDITIEGLVTAIAEDFGVASLTLNFS